MNVKQKMVAGAAAVVLGLAAPVVMHFEGARPQAYLDPIGIPTVCYGHTGPDVRMGQRHSAEQCQALLQRDLQTALAAVDRCAPGLPAQPRAAFTSFAFNAGGEAFCRSTMSRRARARDVPGACAELDRWIYAGGKVLPGLIKRRAAERALCEGRA